MNHNVTHKPTTALPWCKGAGADVLSDTTGEDTAVCCGKEKGRGNAAYIAHSANAYPKLVEALYALLPDAKEPWGMRSRALLRFMTALQVHAKGRGNACPTVLSRPATTQPAPLPLSDRRWQTGQYTPHCHAPFLCRN